MTFLIKGTLSLIFFFLVPSCLSGKNSMKKKERSDSIIRHSSFFVSAHGGPVLNAIIRPQDCFQNGSADGPGLIRNRETIADFAPWVDIADF